MSPDICESECVNAFSWELALRRFFLFEGVSPRGGHRQATEVEVILNRLFFSALAMNRSELVLEFFERALDFPSRRIIFDHLFGT